MKLSLLETDFKLNLTLAMYSKEGIVASKEVSPLTGILSEESVVIDFGEHEGKSVLQINDENPEFYSFLVEQREVGNFIIRRSKDKVFRLYVQAPIQ
jgi:hypothetical protein